MAEQCYLCKEYTGWYLWSSGRDFPRDSLKRKLHLTEKEAKAKLLHTGKPVCMKCTNMLRRKNE